MWRLTVLPMMVLLVSDLTLPHINYLKALASNQHRLVILERKETDNISSTFILPFSQRVFLKMYSRETGVKQRATVLLGENKNNKTHTYTYRNRDKSSGLVKWLGFG